MKKYIAMLSVLIVGCGPSSECIEGEAKCEGNTAYFCGSYSEDYNDVYVWSMNECGKDEPYQYDKHCVVVDFSSGSKGALCTYSENIYEQCKQLNPGKSFCEDNKRLTCTGSGHITSRGKACN